MFWPAKFQWGCVLWSWRLCGVVKITREVNTDCFQKIEKWEHICHVSILNMY